MFACLSEISRRGGVTAVLVPFGLVSMGVLGLGGSAAPPPGTLDATSKAREAAIVELRELPHQSRPFGVEDPSVLVHASLGTPFLYYWADSTFLAFETAEDDAVLNHVTNRYVCFPVLIDGRILGTINVIEADGRYGFGSRFIGDRLCSRMAQAARALDLGDGRRLSFLATGVSGNFFIIEYGARIHEMAVADEWTGRIVGATWAPEEPPVFSPASRFAKSMKREIAAFRMRAASYGNVFGAETHTTDAGASACDVAAAAPWIQRWFDAWELASREILRLPDAPPPGLVFYDSACVYTNLEASLPGIPARDGPALLGTKLSWRAAAHHDSLTLPRGRMPVRLMSFADSDKRTGPYFVMAAPSYWAQMGHGQEPGLTAVFLHEFTHTRQMRGMVSIIGPIDSTWSYPEELNDDAVQTHFGSDSVYVAAYLAERDLLYRAADAGSRSEARALAEEALAMMRSRHARWFTGDQAVFATLDDTFLSLEGAGQWVGCAWLAHPKGGGLGREQAVAKMLGRRRWWAQDHGLALFLVVDRLYPEWPALVFAEPSPGASELLERAIQSR